jgi:hypothetical protein
MEMSADLTHSVNLSLNSPSGSPKTPGTQPGTPAATPKQKGGFFSKKPKAGDISDHSSADGEDAHHSEQRWEILNTWKISVGN